MDSDVKPETVIEACKKRWPQSSGFKISPPTILWSRDMGTKITPYVLTYYRLEGDGDELGSYITADSLAELLEKVEAQP